jgi:hypothetical protein
LAAPIVGDLLTGVAARLAEGDNSEVRAEAEVRCASRTRQLAAAPDSGG